MNRRLPWLALLFLSLKGFAAGTVSISELGVTCEELAADAGQFVLVLPRGKVFEDGLVFTEDDRLVEETTVLGWGKPVSAHPVLKRYLPEPGKNYYAQRVAVIASAGADEYYHWLLQVLGRLGVLEASGVPYDLLYFMPFTRGFQSDTLDLLDVRSSRVIFGDDEKMFQAKELIVPSIPSRGGYVSPVAAEYLRRHFGVAKKRPRNRKLYISRSDATKRKVVNEEALWAVLEPLGFEKVVLGNLNPRYQAEVFAEANTIVAPHGSGLANIVFSRPTTKLIEIHIPEGVNGLFQGLSRQLQLNYTPIQTERELPDEGLFLEPFHLEAISKAILGN